MYSIPISIQYLYRKLLSSCISSIRVPGYMIISRVLFSEVRETFQVATEVLELVAHLECVQDLFPQAGVRGHGPALLVRAP